MKFFRFEKLVVLFCCFTAVFLLANFNVFAQDLSVSCQIERLEEEEKNLSHADYKNLLEKCKTYYEERTEEIGEDIEKTADEKKTLNSAIYTLGRKITSLNYQISQGNIMVKDLGGQISDTQVSIGKTTEKVEDIKGKLGVLLQLRYEEDRRSVVEIFLSEDNLSDFFDNIVALEMINLKTQDFLTNIKNLKTDLESQKQQMDTEKSELENVVVIQTMQKQESAGNKREQETLLKLTEQEYQQHLVDQKSAEESAIKIGNMLFSLLEVPDGGIKFEDAVLLAKDVSGQTGVRAGFSLAILWQETRIGQLKGGCFLRDTKTGDGIYIKSGNRAPRTMKPTRDVQPFLGIIKSLNDAGYLNTDAYHTPVSCAMIRDGSYFGWGSAMGPAQFIPSTWMLFKEKIEAITGSVPANPWNVRDAFLASSLYLKGLGAAARTYEREIYAAMKYFGCTTSWCRRNYGEPVMRVSTCLQAYIDNGAMSSACRNLVF